MAAEAPKIARDGTMEATAKEGIAYLEKEKPALAEDLKKLRDGEEQKENGSGDAPAAENGTPKVPRDNTMVQTAEEGLAYLKRQQNGENIIKGAGLDRLMPCTLSDKSPSKVPKDRTMLETAEEGKKYLEKEGGVNEDAKTRAQEKELNDSKTEEKEATKRSADEQTETEEAKKQKVEEQENGKGEEAAEEKAKE